MYDVLAAVTAAHNPVIPIVANADRSYVSSINNPVSYTHLTLPTNSLV